MKDALSSSISSHHFFMEEKIKDVSLEEMFQRIHKNEYNKAKIIKINDKIMKRRFPVKTDNKSC